MSAAFISYDILTLFIQLFINFTELTGAAGLHYNYFSISENLKLILMNSTAFSIPFPSMSPLMFIKSTVIKATGKFTRCRVILLESNYLRRVK